MSGSVADDEEKICSVKTQQAKEGQCPAIVHESVCLQANVIIDPNVQVGEIQSFCIGAPIIGACPGAPSPERECVFTVSQNICVQVSLNFWANAAAVPTGIVCGSAREEPCPPTDHCTYSVGYFLTHSDLTNNLITAAGGSIVLGIGSLGVSYTVTTVNAMQVLALMTPSPPAPPFPPYLPQYRVLYAQLLAANLNVQNKATCTYAIDAIAAANTFIANSPTTGMDGAPALQKQLEEFNKGLAPGCPEHCMESD